MGKRSYNQNCALARAEDVLGERWTMLILRELLIRPCRYTELQASLPGLGTNLLADRLKELESEGLIEKVDPADRRSPYRLTETGRSIEPVVLSMIRWGYRHTETKSGFIHQPHWDLLAMKALFRPERCRKRQVVQFDSPDLQAWVWVDPERGLEFNMGRTDAASIVFEGTVADFQERLASRPDELPRGMRAFARLFT